MPTANGLGGSITDKSLTMLMRYIRRGAIYRLLSDFMWSDGNLSQHDVQLINKFSRQYNAQHDKEITLEDAVNSLKNTPDIQEIIENITRSATSPERRKFIAAMTIATLSDLSSRSAIYSVENKDLNMMNCNQFLYLESEYDITTNRDITDNFRLITNEFSMIGQHFIYLPMVSKQISATERFDEILMFLYANISYDTAKNAYHNLSSIKTADFCHRVIYNKLNIQKLQYCSPSIITNIGYSIISGKRFDNYLIVNLNDNTLNTIKATCDICRKFLLPTPTTDFTINCNGFYKHLFDSIIETNSVRSTVGVDFQKAILLLPEAGITLSFMHRREKALYLLFMYESKSGGINFNKAATKETLNRYKQRMKIMKRKYELIYNELGGSVEKVPNIELPEIRHTIISIIKRGFLQLANTLDEVEDYIIKRNIFGNYIINLPTEMFVYYDYNDLCYKNISESSIWERLEKL